MQRQIEKIMRCIESRIVGNYETIEMVRFLYIINYCDIIAGHTRTLRMRMSARLRGTDASRFHSYKRAYICSVCSCISSLYRFRLGR